jgi:DNA-binding beta-propeller fold protein YncE
MKKLLIVILILCMVWLSGCGGSTVEVTQVSTLFLPISSSTPEPSPTPSGPTPVGSLLDKNLSLKVVHPTGIKINFLAIGLNNEKYVIDFQGDTIYQLMEDGTLVEHLKFPGKKMDYFNIAPDGSFWFINNLDWGLYHVDDQGNPILIANQMNRLFDFDSAGNLFAVDQPSDNVQKITPDGKVTPIASGFRSQRIGIAPDDSIYIVTFDGDLARVETDGALKIIGTGFGVEDIPAFTPDGTMYVLSWGGLMKVDPSTGQVEQVKWYDRYRSIGGSLVFDKQGIGYIFHPNQPLYRMDLQAQTLELVYSPHGNSWAMGVDPRSEDVFIAYGDRLPSGKTTLFHVNVQGKLDEVGSVPYGMELTMTFAPDGTGYLSVADSQKGSMIYRFKPETGTIEEFITPQCFAQGMAVEPGTEALWWTECDHLASTNAEFVKQTIPYLDGVNNSTIAFGADGTLYALAWFRVEAPNQPMPHGVYRYDNGSWTLVKDMTAQHPGITVAELAICPDGHIYVGGSVEGEIIPQGLDFSSVLRLENDNSLTLIGYGLGNFDILTITCAPSGTVYFTTAQGIYSIPNLGTAP